MITFSLPIPVSVNMSYANALKGRVKTGDTKVWAAHAQYYIATALHLDKPIAAHRIACEKIVRDKDHLAFIRQLPCIWCNAYEVIAAHIRKGTDGGTGLKPGDCWTVPLCNKDHAEQHRIGEPAFFGNMDDVRQLARNLWLLSGDIGACMQVIHNWRTKRKPA